MIARQREIDRESLPRARLSPWPAYLRMPVNFPPANQSPSSLRCGRGQVHSLCGCLYIFYLSISCFARHHSRGTSRSIHVMCTFLISVSPRITSANDQRRGVLNPRTRISCTPVFWAFSRYLLTLHADVFQATALSHLSTCVHSLLEAEFENGLALEVVTTIHLRRLQ